MTVLEELEKIDDDCDKHGIQFVKIDDDHAKSEFGIDSVSMKNIKDLPRNVLTKNVFPRSQPLFTLKSRSQTFTMEIWWTKNKYFTGWLAN